MLRLDRYVFREIFGPLVLGFLVYTFILLMQFLFQSAEMIIQRGVPAEIVGRLLLLNLPNIVVLTIPISLLFGILLAVGRLSSDSELVALRSCGVSLLSLYRPILLLSGLLAAVNVYLMVELLPYGNHASQQLRLEMLTKSVAQQVEPRVFHEEWTGKVLYVFEIPPGQKRWHGVFLAESLPSGEQQVVVAEWGEPRVDEAGEVLVLALENAVVHLMNPNDPSVYRTSHQVRMETVLEDQFTTRQKQEVSASKGIREMDLAELRERIEDPYSTDELRNRARVELQKNFAIPAACLVFGILALPLGSNNRRSGKAAGFVISILVLLLYWLIQSNGEKAAALGKIDPWVAMWAPNAVFGMLGLFLLLRRNRDRGLLVSRIDRWLRRDFWGAIESLRGKGKRRRQAKRDARAASGPVEVGSRSERSEGGSGSPAGAPRLVLRLPHLDLRLKFPNLMDRYVARLFLGIFCLVMLSGLALSVVADLADNLDEILKYEVPTELLVDYYQYLSLQILYTICPIVVLVTTLMTCGLLARTNEITAFKSLGVSLYRLTVPVLLLASLIVAFNAYLQAEVLPASNARVAQIKDRIKGREAARTYRRADRNWIFGHGRFVYNYSHYDTRRQSLQRLQVFELDDQHRLRGRLFTREARYNGDHWILDGGWKRFFDGAAITGYEPFTGARRSDYRETPDYFTSEIRSPNNMTYGELGDYIEEIEGRGQKVPELRVEQYNKIFFPLLSLSMALVALPFGFRLGRQGALYGIGISVVLGMIFMAIFVFFSTLGKAGALPPLVAVTIPVTLFSTFGLYLFLGVRT